MKRKAVLCIVTVMVILLSFLTFSSYAVEEVSSTESNMLISTLDEKLDSSEAEELSEEAVASPEIVGDQYLIAKNVTIPSGIYDGNLYIMGVDVSFSGANIKGNVYAIANNLTLDATTISGSLYTIAGKMEGKNEFNAIDVYAIAQVLDMDATISINRSFKAMGSKVSLNGNYVYDVDLLVGDSSKNYSNMDISKWQDIAFDNMTIPGELTLGNELTIGRNFNYTAKTEANVPSTASIGNINYSVLTDNSSIEFEHEKEKLLSMTTLIKLVVSLINTVFITLAFGWTCKRFRRLNQYHSGVGLFIKSILKGSIGSFLYLVGLILIVVLTALSFGCVGIFGFTTFALAALFSAPIAANMIAINILGIKEEADEGIGYKIAMLGVALVVGIVIFLVGRIPVAGGILSVLFVCMGLGGFLDFVFGNPKHLQEKYQDKMSNKYKMAKIKDVAPEVTEEPKIDNSDAYGNTSVMTDNETQSDVDSTINSATESNIPTENVGDNKDEVKSDDNKSEE